MDMEQLRRKFSPGVKEIIDLCRVTDDFVDKDKFRVYIATIWGNAALDPLKTGIRETELPMLHDFLNDEIGKVLGEGETVTGCFEYLVGNKGDECLDRLQIAKQHRDFIYYFARIIVPAETPDR